MAEPIGQATEGQTTVPCLNSSSIFIAIEQHFTTLTAHLREPLTLPLTGTTDGGDRHVTLAEARNRTRDITVPLDQRDQNAQPQGRLASLRQPCPQHRHRVGASDRPHRGTSMISARKRSPAAGHTLRAHQRSESAPDTMTFPELFALPVSVDLATAARALGISMTTAYRLTRRNAFPCAVMRPTYRYRVPTASLLTALDIDLQPVHPDDVDNGADFARRFTQT